MKYSSKKKIDRKRKTHRKRKTVRKLKNHNKTRKNYRGGGGFFSGLGSRVAYGLGSVGINPDNAIKLGTMVGSTASSIGNRAINYGSRLATEATTAVTKSAINTYSGCSRFQNAYQNFITYQCVTFDEKLPNVVWNHGPNSNYYFSVESAIQELKLSRDKLTILYNCFQKNEFDENSINMLENIIIKDYENHKSSSDIKTANVLDKTTNTRKSITNDYVIRLGLNNGKVWGENSWNDIQNIEKNIEPQLAMSSNCLYSYHYVYEYTLKPMGLDVCLIDNENKSKVLINNATHPQNQTEYYDERSMEKFKCIYIQENSNTTIRGTVVKDYVYLKNKFPKFTIKKIYVSNAKLGTPKILYHKQDLHGISNDDVTKINDNVKAYDITIKKVNNQEGIKSIDDNYYHVYNNERTNQKWYVKLAKNKGMFSERESLTDSFLKLFKQYIIPPTEINNQEYPHIDSIRPPSPPI